MIRDYGALVPVAAEDFASIDHANSFGSFALVLPIHLWFASASLGYSLPAASFRYYLPLWPPLAHAIAFAVVAARTPRRSGAPCLARLRRPGRRVGVP
jgi:hypothetical protein